ncbi:histidyl-tRNA synthetase [Mycoplasmopsis mustelae]|uniref:Histidine--tRNA ligase n=1 Tax=Mycoplasmopsis mustelae TaxID=171289 RepID=A0A4R7UEC5_9BACT|nr:histidine--tRNA ligase [Mycoplasmopsis mustelae]TDV24281.1 histidyl-tRNA synthetase [Mycoplasmopsis mustelae]
MITKIKGTKDYDPIEYQYKQKIIDIFKTIIYDNNFQMIETPIIESCELFKRSVNGSEIAQKQMYEFKDKANRELCLRPEGTAPFVRAYIENNWQELWNQKFAYSIPMFRYEQPQKGRYRQFYQSGIEFVGEKHYLKDYFVITIGIYLLNALEIPYVLKINSIGDKQARQKYEQALSKYLKPYYNELSFESQKRFDEGRFLRILDDKNDAKLYFIKNAPKITDFISKESKEYYRKIVEKLKDINDMNDGAIQEDVSLVRGLDYYDEVVFEFVAKDRRYSNQGTLIGGGRYSGLFAELGGPDVSSVGFGFGVDRLIDLHKEIHPLELSGIKESLNNLSVYVASSIDDNQLELFMDNVFVALTNFGVSVHLDFKIQKTKRIFEKARKRNATVVIYDDSELGNEMFYAKDLKTGKRVVLDFSDEGLEDLMKFLKETRINYSEDRYAEFQSFLGEEDE